MKTTRKPKIARHRRRRPRSSPRRKRQPMLENELDPPRIRGSVERTRALLLAALRVWELKNGFWLLAVPGGWVPVPL